MSRTQPQKDIQPTHISKLSEHAEETHISPKNRKQNKKQNKKNPIFIVLVGIVLILVLFIYQTYINLQSQVGTDSTAEAGIPAHTKITVVLDWFENTNHIGLFVADALGYFSEENLQFTYTLSSTLAPLQLVAGDQADFGFSYQEELTFARAATSPLPVVAIATVLQHNTSAFATITNADYSFSTPADFAGKRYGGFGSYDLEHATLDGLMSPYGVSVETVEILNVGTTDFFQGITADLYDFSWIFLGWTGVEADMNDVSLSYIELRTINNVFDYYTPVIVTNQDTLEKTPDIVRAFLRSVSRGYRYAHQYPKDATKILAAAVPSLDSEFLALSQDYLVDYYMDENGAWGHMKSIVFSRYTQWLKDKNLLSQQYTDDGAFTNDYLP